jgi:pyruvate dehydrogenase E2 component (dihydrolipoamide acetyltransferase)
VKKAPPAETPSRSRKVDETSFAQAHASPAVRRFARELGADLGRVKGSGRKGRILKEDVQAWVKAQLQAGAGRSDSAGGSLGGLDLAPAPEVDFEKYGPVETEPLTKIQKLTGANLHRSWVTIPHVTQFDEADITELEAFRKSMKAEAEQRGVKLTPLPFQILAVVAALKEFPRFNASLSADGENLVMKGYVHIGIAVDTPRGLVVPVIRDADQKGLFQLAEELSDLASRARDRKLSPDDMGGGSFTISSLGGIGGTAFTPIVNPPEVAILGVSKAAMKPVWNDETSEFEPRLMLPLSLSYDHRVIDGVAGARFTSYLAQVLGDIRRLLL